MLNYSGHVNTSSAVVDGTKASVSTELLTVFYLVGIVGSILALLHLHRKKNFKNSKQAFMLK